LSTGPLRKDWTTSRRAAFTGLSLVPPKCSPLSKARVGNPSGELRTTVDEVALNPWLLTHRAWKDYQDTPASVQKAFDKQVGLLAENLRHPSLRAKKYDQANDIWQAGIKS